MQGIVYDVQIEMAIPPTEPNHVVRYRDIEHLTGKQYILWGVNVPPSGGVIVLWGINEPAVDVNKVLWGVY